VVAGSALVKLGLRTLSQYRSVAGRAEPDRVRILSLLDGSSISEAPDLVHFPNEHGAPGGTGDKDWRTELHAARPRVLFPAPVARTRQ